MAVAEGIATWRPEGDSDGDELKKGNTVKIHCSWEGTGNPRPIHVDMLNRGFVSHIKGNCINSGELTLEDFAIESSDNLEWTLGADLPGYPGSQSLTATSQPVAAGVPVTLTVTSYDWGGHALAQIVAGGCAPVAVEFPQDSDKDGLPDDWEGNHFFWPAKDEADSTKGHGAKKEKYNKDLDHTPGVLANVKDGASDQDLDAGDAPVHAFFGDGISAFDEYRGPKIKGKHKNLDELEDDGPIGGKGGPHVKEAFIFAEQPKVSGNIVKLFRKENEFLKMYGILWHEIQKTDMKIESATPEQAGLMDFNGSSQQKGIWLANESLEKGILGKSTLKVSDGVKALVDVKDVLDEGFAETTTRKYIDHVVAHELGHKLTLEDLRRDLEFSPIAIGNPEFAFNVYYFGKKNAGKKNEEIDKKMVLTWLIVETAEGQERKLEFPLPISLGVNALVKKYDTFVQTGEVSRHGADHTSKEREIELTKELADTTDKLRIWSHRGSLMDEISEVSSFQKKLLDDEKQKPDLKQ